MSRVGYARVSTEDQALDLQFDALRKAGCEIVFSDSGRGQSNLRRAMQTLQKGDSLVVWRLDRLGRSVLQLTRTLSDLREREVYLVSIQDKAVDTSTASGELVFNILASVAQFERTLISERTCAGIEAARTRGKRIGRPPVSKQKIEAAMRLHQEGKSVSEACKKMNISRATYYRYLKRGRQCS